MGNALYYSTGQAARELGATQAQIHALCQTKAIPAEVTEGGQLRIPAEVVEKLKRDGLPTVPRPCRVTPPGLKPTTISRPSPSRP